MALLRFRSNRHSFASRALALGESLPMITTSRAWRAGRPLSIPASPSRLGDAGCKTPYEVMTETLSAESARPSPSGQDPVHGISHTRGAQQTRSQGAAPHGAQQPAQHRLPRRGPRTHPASPATPASVGNLSRHHRRQRFSVRDRNPRAPRDRLQAHTAAQHQRAHHKEQGARIKAPARRSAPTAASAVSGTLRNRS